MAIKPALGWEHYLGHEVLNLYVAYSSTSSLQSFISGPSHPLVSYIFHPSVAFLKLHDTTQVAASISTNYLR